MLNKNAFETYLELKKRWIYFFLYTSINTGSWFGFAWIMSINLTLLGSSLPSLWIGLAWLLTTLWIGGIELTISFFWFLSFLYSLAGPVELNLIWLLFSSNWSSSSLPKFYIILIIKILCLPLNLRSILELRLLFFFEAREAEVYLLLGLWPDLKLVW